MTWEIVLGIIALFGFIVSVITPILKLTKIMTQLTLSVESLREAIDQISARNTESHRRLWEHNTEQDETLNNHEKRITKIEYDMDKYHGSN
jgi:hypothetical protein